MEIRKIELMKPIKENNYAKLDRDIKDVYCVYLLFDKNLDLLYIGRTKHLRQRLLQHLSPDNEGRYNPEYEGRVPYNSKLPYGIVKYFSILEVEDFVDAEITELLLIKFLKPIFNYKNNREIWDEYLSSH